METQDKLVEVFSGNLIEADFIKSQLKNAEIEAVLKDEIMGTLFPWYVGSGGLSSVKVLVFEADVEKALIIIDEFGSTRKKEEKSD